MTMNVRNWRLVGLVSIATLLLATTLVAAERRARPTKIGQYDPSAETVEMFAAIEKGDISVKLIPKDSTESQVLIKNKTGKPLNVKLPDAFAGVPVLGQDLGRGNNRSNRSGGGNNNSGNQGMGGGMGGMGGMMGGGMGAFNVPPEKVGKFKVPTVCLDHGKAEPRAAIPYEIKPIESYSSKPGVRELCQMLGNGKMNQRAAQAAAWHLNNNMSWQELAAKRVKHLNAPSQPYFSQAEIQAGMQIASTAIQTAKETEKAKEKAKDKPALPSSISSPASGK
jgi:hypothetical protein